MLLTLPQWIDEGFTYGAIQRPFIDIVTGHTGLVPISGYYVLLAIWYRIWHVLPWLRLSSFLCFILNIYLIHLLTKKLYDATYANIVVFLYIFSGYFVIFDWQARMYSGTTSLILGSLLLLFSLGKPKYIYAFTALNIFGLFYDYSFFWYFFTIIVYALIHIFLYSQKEYKNLLLSALISAICVIPWILLIRQNINIGLAGIMWIKPYISPVFFLPFFLGTHQYILLTIGFIILCMLGLKPTYDSNQIDEIGLLSISTLIIGYILYFFSILFHPIFHVRNLQIVGIICILLMSRGIYFLNRKYHISVHYFYILCILSFWLTIRNIYLFPGIVLLKF